jgi:hypothetical protein
MPPTPTQIRLTEEDLAAVARLRLWYGLPSLTAALRYAVGVLDRAGPPTVPPQPPRRKPARRA